MLDCIIIFGVFLLWYFGLCNRISHYKNNGQDIKAIYLTIFGMLVIGIMYLLILTTL